MDEINKYLNELKSRDPETRQLATQGLWALWYREAGDVAELELQRGTTLMQTNKLAQAEKVFKDLILTYPDFSEAHNKLATIFYLQNRFAESVALCKKTLEMNPHHFGAWNGQGLCLYHLGKFDEAIRSFKRALEIQPYAHTNQRYIERCLRKLN